MLTNQDQVLISFASGILRHFSNIDISGKHTLMVNSIKITILVYNKNISVIIPYNVISNAITNIEAFQCMRFEIIEELTIAIRKVSK